MHLFSYLNKRNKWFRFDQAYKHVKQRWLEQKAMLCVRGNFEAVWGGGQNELLPDRHPVNADLYAQQLPRV